MKIDRKIPMLFIPPVVAVFLCLASSLVLPDNTHYRPAQPEFLAIIDQLSLFTMEDAKETTVMKFRDVFRHEWTMSPSSLPGYAAAPAPPEAPPPRVTMIVEAGPGSFCIINGRRMHAGDKADGFSVTSIGKDHVTITRQNGTREIHHVKAY